MSVKIDRKVLESRLAQSRRLASESFDPLTRSRLSELSREIESMIAQVNFDDLTRQRDDAAALVDGNIDPAATDRLAKALQELEVLLKAAKPS